MGACSETLLMRPRSSGGWMWITTTVAVVLRLVVGVAVSAPVEVAVFFFSPEALEGVPHGGHDHYLTAAAAALILAS